MAIALGLVPSTALRAQSLDWSQTSIKPKTVEIPSSTMDATQKPTPKIRLVIPDLQLCPGQEYDIPVYIEISDENTRINTFTIGFRFPDYELLEPTGHISDIHESLRNLGNPAFHYSQNAARNLPDHMIAFSWIQTDGSRPLRVKSGQLLFRFRVKYKKEGEARIDFVGGSACTRAWTFSCFTVNSDEGTVLGNNKGEMKIIPNYLGVEPNPQTGVWANPDTIQYTPAYIQTGKPTNISVIPDTMMCIGNSIHFWAEGGESYEWKDVSGMERPYPKSMDDPREQKPLFKPVESGIYTFQCKIVDKQGCVGYLYTKCLVRDNSLLLDVNPKDAMVAKGTQVTSSVKYGNSPDYRYKINWSPAAVMFEPPSGMGFTVSENGLSYEKELEPDNNVAFIGPKTKAGALQKAQWITIDLKDNFCRLQIVQNINVIGDSVRGEMTLEPHTICRIPGKDNIGVPVQAKVRVHGGSGGPYQYQWSAKNLEPTIDAWNPVLQTEPTSWSACRLMVYRDCEVRCRVIDHNGSKTTVLIDTIRTVTAKPTTLTLEDHSGNATSCEREERVFEAKTTNVEKPKYEWYINEESVLYTTQNIFATSALKVGDKVHCVMRTNDMCVTNNELRSNTIHPPVVYPNYMQVQPGFGNGAENMQEFSDYIWLNIAHHFTGNSFRLRWYSNDEILLFDERITNPEAPEDTVLNHPIKLPRAGYYDYYRAVVTGSDRACLINDSLSTTTVQNFGGNPRLSPARSPEAGIVYMDKAVEEGICEGDAFYAYAKQIRYLPKDFRVVWYMDHVNPNDTRTNAVAYYATPGCGLKRNDTCGASYCELPEYESLDEFHRIQKWVLDGFKVRLVEGEGQADGVIHDGDSLFYRVETLGKNGQTLVWSQSPKKVLKTRPSVYEHPDPNFVADKDHLQHCEGEVFRFFPPSPSSDTIQYTWFVNGRQVVPGQLSQINNGSDGLSETKQLVAGQYSELKGDTLITKLYNNAEIRMRATNTYQCYKPYVRSSEKLFTPSLMFTGFRVIRQRDTMVCSGDSVALWAYGEPYNRRYTSIRLPNKPGVPNFLPEYEDKILMSWAYSKEDLLSGNTIKDTTLSIKVAIDSAAFGDRSDDFNNPNAVVGSRKYYLRMTNYASGCTSYDSIVVSVGYHRTPSIVITPEPAFPWCEGMQEASLKLSGALWGNPDSMRVRINPDPTWYHVDEKRNDSLPYIPEMMTDGTMVDFRINNPMAKSCNHQSTGKASIKLNIRPATMALMRKGKDVPDEKLTTAVCAGESITLEGLGATMSELQAVSGKRLTTDQIIERLHRGYIYRWINNTTGDTVGRERFLTVKPDQPTTYTLLAQDTALRCAPGEGPALVQIAVRADVNVKFFDSVLKKEVPFSLCEGGNLAELSFRAYPTFFNEGAAFGFAVYSAADRNNPRQHWESYNKDTVFTAKFEPGDRLMYAYLHDTIACDGKDHVMKSVDMQLRPDSRSFVAAPDTLLCGDNSARLRLEGAKHSDSELPDGSPSLREFLIANNVVTASELSTDPMVYWLTVQDGLSSSEHTSFTPLVNPAKKAIYYAVGYNEYGCIQVDSVRVERHGGADKIEFKLVLPVDSVLCNADSLWFSLDRYESSILSPFDSLVWKRIPHEKLAFTDSGAPSGLINAPGVEILNSNFGQNSLYAHVEHGDVVYVDGYISPNSKKVCDNVATQTGWYRSNKIVVRSYKRPTLALAQMEAEACVDSTLHLTAQTAENVHVRWLNDPTRSRYEILFGRDAKTVQIKTTSNQEGYVYTKVYAEAYEHPSCATRDSIEVEVKTLSDMNLALSTISTVCNNDPVTVRIKELENVETWHWRLAPANEAARDMTYEDFKSNDKDVIEDFLSNILSSFDAPFRTGDRIWAEGHTTTRCVRNHVGQSDTITITRGVQPKIVWLEPAFSASQARVLEGCAQEPLSLRWKLYHADRLLAMETDQWQNLDLVMTGTQDSGKIYEWVGTYPATPKNNPSANGLLRMQVMADAGGCRSLDTLRIEAHPKDTLKIEIATSSVSSICQGEEAMYGLSLREHVDSVVWYHNGLRMKSGSLDKASIYICRPNPGDRVWAVGYNRSSSACPVFNGLRSNDVTVNVIAGGRYASGAVSAALSASADSVCGFGQPVYTLRGKGFDSVYWYANGYLMAITNVNTGITTNPDVVEATWQRTPRLTAYGLDSVYAIAVRTKRACAERDSVLSKLVTVYRREMPQVKIEPRDASVWPGKDVSLSATGASRYVWWTDMQDDIAGLDQTFEFTMIDDTVGVYVMGYEPAYNEDSLAGGAALRPAANAYDKFGCRNFDQVRVKPASASEDEVIIYIPNTVLLNSTRAADRVFKVFGERIASVEMRVFNSGGDLVFSKTAEDPVWNPQDATTGNYSYRLVITMTNGEKVNKNGWVSVLE